MSYPLTPTSSDGLGDRLNPASFIPLYVQLTEILQERIERRTLPAGSRFSSEAELSDEFEVSRAVVRPALTILENNGLLIRVKGKGTFIAPEKSTDRVRGLTRDLATPQQPGRGVEVTDIKLETADWELRVLLDLESKPQRIMHAASLIRVDDRMVGFRDSFISLSRVPVMETLLKIGTVTSADRLKLDLAHTNSTIETSFCTPFEAALFKVSPGSPTLLVRCVEYRGRGLGIQAVEMARMVYRADVVTLEAVTR